MSLLRQAPWRPLCRLCIRQAARPAVRTLATTRPSLRQPGRRQQEQFRLDAARPRAVTSQEPKIPQGERPPSKMKPGSLPSILNGRLDEWVTADRVMNRLILFGFDKASATECLDEWAAKVRYDLEEFDRDDENFLSNMNNIGWDAHTLILAYESGSFGTVFEAAFLRHFLEWSVANGPDPIRLHLRSLLQATDVSKLDQGYQPARSLKRQFHLHMGPTNSGKTYNALKALSTAGSGVYAGPLRLLAHEVWERINLGSVGELDGKGRACNLLTGEERRIVNAEAGLVSCTVEMLPLSGKGGEPWDVVVIDEIQMMGDEQRGGAWTNAVIGANAKEIHLCGDDTTAALLQSMIDGFKGDTLTIHRYERLTPLAVAQESLRGDWNRVEPGDCIVTFSRSNVFSVKKLVEQAKSMKCAVVYGALPPETRAEQARNFNDERGRAEVLVASDAVGMGLNLKIRRIIFESLTKWNGQSDVPLSLSQIKQIAGRAGRFGQTRKDDDTAVDEAAAPGGIVTTLHDADLPLLRAMLPLSLPPLTRAYVDLPTGAMEDLAPLLPPNTSYGDLLDVFTALAKVPPLTILQGTLHKLPLAEMVEPHRNVLTLRETELFGNAPVNVRDDRVAAVYANMLAAYSNDFLVNLEDVIEPTGLIGTLKTVEETLAALPPLPPVLGVFRPYLSPAITISAIPLLESLHKALVMYLWLSFRLELAFPDREKAAEYKERTEKVLEICLERMPGMRQKKTHERSKAGDRELALYRRKYVDKHGLIKPDIEWVQEQQVLRGLRADKFGNIATVKEEDSPAYYKGDVSSQ